MFLDVWTWIWPISIGLLLGLILSQRKKIDLSQLQYLVPEEFSLNMRKGQLIDVRKEEEFKKIKINGSRSFPKRSVFSQLNKLRRDQAIFIVASDKRSMHAKAIAKKLLRKGFKPIYILKGGIENWPYHFKEN